MFPARDRVRTETEACTDESTKHGGRLRRPVPQRPLPQVHARRGPRAQQGRPLPAVPGADPRGPGAGLAPPAGAPGAAPAAPPRAAALTFVRFMRCARTPLGGAPSARGDALSQPARLAGPAAVAAADRAGG